MIHLVHFSHSATKERAFSISQILPAPIQHSKLGFFFVFFTAKFCEKALFLCSGMAAVQVDVKCSFANDIVDTSSSFAQTKMLTFLFILSKVLSYMSWILLLLHAAQLRLQAQKSKAHEKPNAMF